MFVPNIEIRQVMLQSGLRHWQVAQAIGITPYTFSVWLRQELTETRLKRVLDAINLLKAGDRGES